jgi:hypothetical protein
VSSHPSPTNIGKQVALVNWSHAVNPTFCLPIPEEDLVPSIFFKYFEVDDPASGHGLLSCLPARLSGTEEGALTQAILSVGYVLLARLTKSSDKLKVARQKYGEAVRLTCNALQTTVARETCGVMRVILILAFFEVCHLNMPNLQSSAQSIYTTDWE